MSDPKRQCQTCLYWEMQTGESGQCIRAMSPFYDEITNAHDFCNYWTIEEGIQKDYKK